MTKNLQFSRTRDVKLPNRGTSGSAGIDFYIPNDWNEGKPYIIHPNKDVLIPTGIFANIPEGYALIGYNKSGVSVKKKLRVGANVVDSDYQGEIHIHLFNDGEYSTTINPGDKILQFLLMPVDHQIPQEVPFETLYKEKSERGDGWQGSTGEK